MSDDLVERVALAIADAYYRSASNGQLTLQDTDTIPEDWEAEARAAIAVALEEAARVVDSMAEDLAREFEPSPSIAWVREKAAAIRAMIPKRAK